MFRALALVALLAGCSTTHPRRNPVGERFPSVVARTLADKELRIPEDLAGKPALLLVGYKMETQFDLDRWILGLQASGIQATVYEIPTIKGMLPGMFSGSIDSGMRSGIPPEDWPSVATVYGDASKITRFLGDETPLPGRVVLLDGAGVVVFFHDHGYSAGQLQRLRETLAKTR